MKNVPRSLYWLSLAGVNICAALFVSALVVASSSQLQITSMMELERGSSLARYYGGFYTSALAATALAGIILPFLARSAVRSIVPLLAGFSLALTIAPVGYSLLHNCRPGFYENYFGETFTAVALLSLAVTAGIARKT